MMNYIVRFVSLIWKNIGKIGFVISLSIGLFIAFFPLGDLSDFISNQVYKASAQKVYVQFQDLSFNPATMTIELDQVELDTPVAQELKAGKIQARPSLMSILNKAPGGSIELQDFLGGNTKLNLATVGSIEDPSFASSINIDMQQISLAELNTSLKSPVPLSGELSVNSQVALEFENKAPAGTPPMVQLKSLQDGDVTILIRKFKMPATSITSPQIGRLGLPLIEFSNVELKAKIQKGKITIESGNLGGPSDEFFGTIRGDLTLSNPLAQNLMYMFQSYNITVEFSAKQSFKDRAGFLLAFLQEDSTDPSGLSKYTKTFTMNGMGLPNQ